MDQYDYCTLDDALAIAVMLNAGSPVWFGYSNNLTTFTVFIAPPAPSIGQLPYGGRPHGRYVVGIVYVGCFHFDLRDGPLFPNYVGEKLKLPESDATAVTDLLNAIRHELLIEQGTDSDEETTQPQPNE